MEGKNIYFTMTELEEIRDKAHSFTTITGQVKEWTEAYKALEKSAGKLYDLRKATQVSTGDK